MQLGRTNEAIDDAQQLLEKQHLDGMTADIAERARFVRAAARYQLRLYPDAHADLQTIMGDNPQNVKAHPHHIDAISTRAAVEAELNLTAMARADYDTLIKLQPNESSYYIERAKMLIRLGEKKAARNDLDTAVRMGVPQGMVHLLYQQVR